MMHMIKQITVHGRCPSSVVANLWHGCQKRHSKLCLWAPGPSPQHTRQGSKNFPAVSNDLKMLLSVIF
ncbi:hypothetical protein GDO81_010098 [Engystomops pustulosus]|uniref:Uncharacterized protein n=1 Tax=Engystomops pustulosus TaxID=76066 RepID=A0AAV7BWX0_ENGPU|nr:hypothetical protein GDO81_010098 [Engystomops pustulosus]